jgi:membrane associated rhomboid family serine protease
MPRLRTVLLYAASLAVGAVAASYGYGFGLRISGPWLAVLLAANTAVFAVLLLALVLDKFVRLD